MDRQPEPILSELLTRANHYVTDKNYQEAIDIFDEIINCGQSPELIHAYKGKALAIHYSARSSDQERELALRICNKAIELDDQFTDAHFVKAQILATTPRKQEAMAACDKTITLDERYAGAYAIKSSILAGQNNIAGALSVAKEGLKHDPENHTLKMLVSEILPHAQQAQQEMQLSEIGAGAAASGSEVNFVGDASPLELYGNSRASEAATMQSPENTESISSSNSGSGSRVVVTAMDDSPVKLNGFNPPADLE